MVLATALALISAVIHASWNLLITTGEDRGLAAWGQFLSAAVVSLVGLVVVGGPGWQAVPYLVGTGLVHVVYVESLVAAYEHGDFSMSYPLARGTGAVLAALGAAALLDDRLSAWSWVAIAIAGIGLMSLRIGNGVAAADDIVLGTNAGGPASAAGTPDRALGYALLTGVCIATYSIIDSAGARGSASGVSYGFAAIASAGTAVSLNNACRPGRRSRAALLVRDWRRNLLGGVGTVAAYTLVLVAVKHAPVGYVTMLRESSVVFGALIGWLLLDESMGKVRLISSGVILAGLVMLVAVR